MGARARGSGRTMPMGGYAPVYPYGPAAPNIQFHSKTRNKEFNMTWGEIMLGILFIVGLIAVPWVLWGARVGYNKTAVQPASYYYENMPELQEWGSRIETKRYESYVDDPVTHTTVWYVGVPTGTPNYATLGDALTALETLQADVGTRVNRLTIYIGSGVAETDAFYIGDWSTYVMDYLCLLAHVPPSGSAVALRYTVSNNSLQPEMSASPLAPTATLGPMRYVGGVQQLTLHGLQLTATAADDTVLADGASQTGVAATIPTGNGLWVHKCIVETTDAVTDGTKLMQLNGTFSGALWVLGSELRGSRDHCAFETTECAEHSYMQWFIFTLNHWHDNMGSGATRGRMTRCDFVQSMTEPLPAVPSTGLSGTAVVWGNVYEAQQRSTNAWAVIEVKSYSRVVYESNYMNLNRVQRTALGIKPYIGFYSWIPASTECPWELRVVDNVFEGVQVPITIPFNRTRHEDYPSYGYIMPTPTVIVNNTLVYDEEYGAGVVFRYKYYGTSTAGLYLWPTGETVIGVDSYVTAEGVLLPYALESTNTFTSVPFV